MVEKESTKERFARVGPVSLLLRTKFFVPSFRSDALRRRRLTQHLDESLRLGRKLTLISAPAGFGKTTLLSEWVHGMSAVHTSSPQVAWISLDEGDNDPTRFLTYLIGALQTVDARIGEGMTGALQSPQPPPIESILTVLVNEIAVTIKADPLPNLPYVIILDDYHGIKAPLVHRAVSFLLDHLPPPPEGVHLVISSRSDPPLPLARLRARGRLTELRAADLRFTADEAAAFLNEVMSLNLAAEEVAALETRTEGWITGLQLAALSLQRQDAESQSRFLQGFTGSNRYVLDYLLEEVLNREPEPVREFLLQTSILDRLSAPLCDAVTRRDGLSESAADGQTMLERLERDNLFIVPLDNERRWYRYHRLFADLLRSRLGRERAVPLHRRASIWCEKQGLSPEAIHHALAAGDFERVAELIEESALPLLMRGELVTLLGWLAPVPDEAIDARPWLAIYHAWALLLTGQTDAVEPRLQAAERSEIKERRSEMLGHATAIRAYLAALQRDVPHAIELAQEALALLPKDELVVRGVVSFTLGGACLMHGDASGASQAFAKAGAIGQAAGNIHLAVPAMSRLAELKIEQGHLHQAAQVLQQAMDLVTRPDGRPLPVAAQPHSGMGDLLYEWNDLDAALQHLRKSVELGRQWGNADALAADYCGLARVHQAQGPAEQALDALQEAEQLVREREPSPLMVAQVAAHRARLMLSQGDLTAATRWAASREAELCADEEPEYMREFEYLTLVRILIARGRYDEALNMLERLLETAERGGRMGRAIGILVLQALAFQALGRNDQAAAMLERALSLAEPEGYVRTFLDEGEPMVELLRRAAAQGIAVEYARKLLIAFDAWEIERVREDRPAAHTPALVEPLSDRELEVLRLVAAGLTNREIAKELVIAVSTVKSHTNHIYGKLGVKNRTQAVAQARALGLF